MAVNGWFVFFGLLWAYIVFLIWLHRSGRMQKWNLSLMLGLVLMIRTQRGKGTIDAVSKPRRFWNAFGDFGIALSLVGMVAMTLLMAVGVWGAIQQGGGGEAFGITEVIIIPGVTPFVPLWYGVIALIVALVVHEGGHGVLARANRLKVKSLGLLYAIVPVGAFVEPDEEELAAAPRRHRLRVFAAGATVNIVVASILLVAMGAMAADAEAKDGVPILGVIPDSAAEAAGVKTSDIIIGIDNETVVTNEAFSAFMETTVPGQDIAIRMDDGRQLIATLGSRWDDQLTDEHRNAVAAIPTEGNRSEEHAPMVAYCDAIVGPQNYTNGGECADALTMKPFLGISHFPVEQFQSLFTDPFGNGGLNMAQLAFLPIGEVRGQPVLGEYMPTFFDEPFPGFWIVFTTIFWIFWINLMLGVTNILPLLPLDGGHIFRDAVGAVVARVAPKADPIKRDAAVGRAAGIMSFMILGMFLFTILAPRIL